jgi:hypothetical protein
MQKTACPVRTRQAIEDRTALGLLREMQTGGRALTTRSLHKTWRRDAITLSPCTGLGAQLRPSSVAEDIIRLAEAFILVVARLFLNDRPGIL